MRPWFVLFSIFSRLCFAKRMTPFQRQRRAEGLLLGWAFLITGLYWWRRWPHLPSGDFWPVPGPGFSWGLAVLFVMAVLAAVVWVCRRKPARVALWLWPLLLLTLIVLGFHALAPEISYDALVYHLGLPRL